MFFGKGLRLGTIGGITIRLDYSWFVIFALVVFLWATELFPHIVPGVQPVWYWLTSLLTSVLFFASVLGHELTHALVARRNNIPIHSITLFIFGGVAQMEDEPPTAWAEFKMAIAGPLSSVVFGLFFYVLGVFTVNMGSHLLSAAFTTLGFINVFLAVFNMLPAFPLDGGRVFRSIIWGISGNLVRSTQVASISGQLFGLAFIAFGVLTLIYPPLQMLRADALWGALIGWFLFSAARSGYQQMILRETLRHVPVETIMNPTVQTVPADISVEHLVTEFFLRETPSTLPVEQQGKLLGTVSIEDVRAVPRQAWGSTLVSEIVHPLADGQTLTPKNDAWDAANLLAQGTNDGLLVTEDSHVEGIVTRGSIMRWLQTHTRLAPGQA